MADWAKTQTHHAAEAVSRVKLRLIMGAVIFTPAVVAKVLDPTMTINPFS